MHTLVIYYHFLVAAHIETLRQRHWVSEERVQVPSVWAVQGLTNFAFLFLANRKNTKLLHYCLSCPSPKPVLQFAKMKMHQSQCMAQGHRVNQVNWIRYSQSLRHATILAQWGGSENRHSENRARTIISSVNSCSEYRKLNSFHIVVIARRYKMFHKIPFLSYFITLLN